MRLKARKRAEGVEGWKRRAAPRKLAGLKGKALERELDRAVRALEAGSGARLLRHKGRMVTARPIRLAQ